MAGITIQPQAAPEVGVGRQALGICERLGSIILFLLASPVLVGSALALVVLSGRSPLIAHRRVGWQGWPLWVLKLRTMWPDGTAAPGRRAAWIEYIDDEHGPQLKHPADPRLTSRFARFCRRYSIDELPQLWHVIRGEMSLVGPRPMTERELQRYYGPVAQEILQVKPGISGLWQISGRNRLTYAQRRNLDLRLVREPSVRLYVEILMRTVPEVLRGSGSW